MGKKWKRLLVQRRAQAKAAPVAKPVASNSEMIEHMETTAPAPEPEVAEDAPVVEEEPVVETQTPPRRRPTRRKKTLSES
jgi:hypothetical protein